MSDLLSGFAQYLTFMDEIPLFNSESFIANKHNRHKKFFADFCSTQIFRQFLQNDSKETFPYFFKIENQNKKAISSNCRQSCFLPRTSVLDVSKFIHIRSISNSNFVVKEKEKGNISNKTDNEHEKKVGVRFFDDKSLNISISDLKEKDKARSKFLFI